jgi:acyl-CoA synthetase (AMP-forming)/AMP-acid ligase II
VCTGYWGDDAATARAFGPDGYLRTGDVGTLYDGELYVTGRLEEIVTLHGRHLYPQDIERGLRARHAELTGAGAAFTVPLDDALNEEALVVTHEVSGRLTEDRLRQLAAEIRRTVAREFGVYLGGVSLLRRGAVRRTTSGKIQRTAMRQLFLECGLNAVYAEHGPQVANALRLRQLAPAGL